MSKYKDMTWNDLVRRYFPDANDQACEFILYERTPFPFCSAETIEEYLQEFQVDMLAEKRSNHIKASKEYAYD